MPEWLTYTQAGARFGLSADAARMRAHRLGWRTQPGNDGRTLVQVPDDATVRPRPRSPARSPERSPEDMPERSGERAPAQSVEINRLAALLTTALESVERAEKRAAAKREKAGIQAGRVDK